jgi:hypothetical protein
LLQDAIIKGQAFKPGQAALADPGATRFLTHLAKPGIEILACTAACVSNGRSDANRRPSCKKQCVPNHLRHNILFVPPVRRRGTQGKSSL